MAKTEQIGVKFDLAAAAVASIPAVIFVVLVTLVPEIRENGPLMKTISWVPSLGVSLSLLVDGLSLLFGLIITLVGALVVLYAGGYLAGDPGIRRFYLLILLFMIAMLGVVFSRDLITLFVFWELTGVSSFLLIGYYHTKAASRKAAQQALIVTGTGGLVLLAGFLLIGMETGSYDLQTIFGQAAALKASPLYGPILILVLIGAFTKSAQFPFHFWLPGAMEAPAPVSAYLHSATMVKAGVYLIARLMPALGGTALWTELIAPVGAITMLIGAWIALSQTDLKRLLAYSTVSVLGMLTFLLGLGTSLSVKAALVVLVAHALYKGALFLAAGAVDHEAGTRDIRMLGGLRRWMPFTAAAALIAGLSQSGVPPLFGFIAKELLYEVTLAGQVLLTGAAFAASTLLVVAAALVAVKPFWGEPPSALRETHEAPWQMTVGPLILGALSLGFGFFPGWAGKTLIEPAVGAVLGKTYEVKLALWHGFTPMLLLSALTILAGAALYFFRGRARSVAGRLDPGRLFGPERIYRLMWRAIEWFAQAQTLFLQNGSLPHYLMTVVLTAIVFIGLTMVGQFDLLSAFRMPEGVRVYELVFLALILAATLAVVRSRSRLAAVAALGVVGYSMAMIYILRGAPDLAMTQFAIETLTVILFVLVLYRLPVFTQYTGDRTRLRDALIAVSAGVMMTFLVIAVTARPLISRLTPFFAGTSYTVAKGRNIVNVILVDFRGIDTLGEITVLAVAAIGVVALMKFRSQE